MKVARIVVAVISGLAALSAVQPAEACELTKTQWGLRAVNCLLGDFYKGRFDLAVELNPSRPVLRLPNLHVTDIDTSVRANNVDMQFDVENNGNGNAVPFEVTLVGSVHNPLSGGANVSMMAFPPVTVPALAAGATATRFAGTLVLPNRSQDWDVCGIAIADPPLTNGPAFGSVFESNESDNMRNDCCRVFGPNPDVTGPPPC